MSDPDKTNYLNNNIYARELVTLDNLLKQRYVCNEHEKRILNSSTDDDNFNEIRLRLFFTYTSVLPLSDPTYRFKSFDYLCDKEISQASSELGCWLFLSNMVKKREAIGFPLIYNICELSKSLKTIVSFEANISKVKLNSVYDLTFSKVTRLNQIKFQKLLISYTLYKNNIMYNNLFYETYNIPKTSITFKINDIYFKFDGLICLVILSPKTNIYFNANINIIIENNYLSDVLSQFVEQSDKNFIEYLLTNFNEYIDGNYFPITSFFVLKDTENIDEYPNRGSLVKFRDGEGKFYYGILVDYHNSIYKIYFYSDIRQRRGEFFQIEIFERENIFKPENIIPFRKTYIIGK